MKLFLTFIAWFAMACVFVILGRPGLLLIWFVLGGFIFKEIDRKLIS